MKPEWHLITSEGDGEGSGRGVSIPTHGFDDLTSDIFVNFRFMFVHFGALLVILLDLLQTSCKTKAHVVS